MDYELWQTLDVDEQREIARSIGCTFDDCDTGDDVWLWIEGKAGTSMSGKLAVLCEHSTAILEELEQRHPELPLYPVSEARRAETRLFIDWFNRVWKRPPNELEAELREEHPDRGRVDELAARLAGSRDLFEALLARRIYLLGDHLSAADCAAFPFLKYALFHDPADEELFHRLLVEHLSLDGAYPRLETWIRHVDGHPRS